MIGPTAVESGKHPGMKLSGGFSLPGQTLLKGDCPKLCCPETSVDQSATYWKLCQFKSSSDKEGLNVLLGKLQHCQPYDRPSVAIRGRGLVVGSFWRHIAERVVVLIVIVVVISWICLRFFIRVVVQILNGSVQGSFGHQF